MVLGAREFDGAAVSAVRMAYKSMPRVWAVVKARDASIYYHDHVITRLSSLALRSILNYITSIGISRASMLTSSLMYVYELSDSRRS